MRPLLLLGSCPGIIRVPVSVEAAAALVLSLEAEGSVKSHCCVGGERETSLNYH